jgi:hypothetical protein
MVDCEQNLFYEDSRHSNMTKKMTTWWGNFTLEENQRRFWQVGPLSLSIERLPQEWRLATEICETSEDVKIALEDHTRSAKNDLPFKRFVFQKSDSLVNLIPILADRAQVSRAETPFYLPAGESVIIYVSSPVWIRIEAGEQRIKLDEIPTLRQSDTWYGPNTCEGELCYFSPMFCRTQLAELTMRPYRIISPVVVHNNDKQALLLERLSLPLPYLSVYADNQSNLWTEEIIVKNEPNSIHSVRHGKGAPHVAPYAKLISAPRLSPKALNFVNLFYNLLREK